MSERLTAQLLDLLGRDAFIRLCEAYGGTRLYASIADGELPAAIGDEAAQALAARFGGACIRVPLAREVRARHYRAALSMSNAQIARKLGVTETAVDKLFHRMPAKPVKGSRDPRQIDMFD